MKSNQEKFDALAWKCNELGISYGQLINSHDESEIHAIYKEYLQHKAKMEKEKRKHHETREDLSSRTIHKSCFGSTISNKSRK